MRFRISQRRLVRGRINLEQHLAIGDEIPFDVFAADNITADLRADTGVDIAREGTNPLAVNRHVFLFQCDEFNRGRRRRGLSLFAASSGGPAKISTSRGARRNVD